MSAELTENIDLEAMPPVMTLEALVLMLLAVTMGAFMAAVMLPSWLPGLSTSLLGPDPKVYWFLSRASALVGFSLLWLSMALGLIITNKMARIWPGGPVAFDLHQHASLLGLAFGLFHALILMGDSYINYSLVQVLTPFASVDYEPFWVGLGQIGFYLWGVVAISFYVRGKIGTRTWRLVHFLAYFVFMLTLLHGIASGTDSETPWALGMYWFSGASLLFLSIYRVLVNLRSPVVKRAA